MNIRIKTTNVSMTPALSDYVDKRLDKIAKLIGDDPSLICDVEFSRTTAHHQKGDIFRAEIHIVGDGIDAYSAAEHEDLHMAIADVKDEIVRELRGHKGKQTSLMRRSGARVKAMMKGILPWGEAGWYQRFK